jgi:integrase/recombinase XerD
MSARKTLTKAYIDDFLVSRRARNCTPRTISWYKDLLSPFARVNPRLPLSSPQVERFLGALDARDETRHAYYRALRAFYTWLARREGCLNPMADVGQPRRRKKVPYSLSMAELLCLFAVTLCPRDRALLELLVDTGVRISEAINLTAEDVQDEVILVSGKTGERQVPLSPGVREHLLALGKKGTLFTGTRGQLTRSGAYRIVKLALARAGITAKKRGPHTLRHTFGRQYIMAGGDLVSLQRILGHTDIKTTRIYAELDLSDITIQHARFSPLVAMAGASLTSALKLNHEKLTALAKN